VQQSSFLQWAAEFGCADAYHRFTRLTNAFSKKIENHVHSVALFAMCYNFVRIRKTDYPGNGRQGNRAALGNG
jgi:hypothetical protein